MIDNESQPAKALVYRIATEICQALVSVWTHELAHVTLTCVNDYVLATKIMSVLIVTESTSCFFC